MIRTCIKCNVEKSLELFYKKSKRRPSGICKECEKSNRLRSYYANPELHKARSAKARAKSLYKLTGEQYDIVMQIKNCEICNSSKNTAIDHCHKTKVYRGRICKNCNTAIGFVKDNPDIAEKLSSYLRERGVPDVKNS